MPLAARSAAVEEHTTVNMSDCLQSVQCTSSGCGGIPPPPSVSEGRGRNSGRSHRHRRRRSRSRSQRYRKVDERNLFAAVCSMVVMVLLCTAMADPQWFYLYGGGCARHTTSTDVAEPVHYLGLNQFFYFGQFRDPQTKDGHTHVTVYQYAELESEILVDCVTQRSMTVLRSLIGLCFVGVGFSLVAFLLDLAGPTAALYRFFHRNAIFSILTVVVCVVVNGLSYLVIYELEKLQIKTKPNVGNRVVAQFGGSFYLVAAAGVMAIVATACNLLRRYGDSHFDGIGSHTCSAGRSSPEDHQQLLGDYDGNSGGSSPEVEVMPSSNVAPPPPYEP